jgi:ABC-2 type transport system permease protein
MLALLRYSLTRLRGQIIGWGLVLFVFGWMTVLRYEVVHESQELVRQLLQGPMAKFIRAFGDPDRMTTPAGFLSMALFSYLPLILGVFAVLVGSGLLVADEENGTLDLVLAHPVSRTALFMARLLAFLLALLVILSLAWLGFMVTMSRSSLKVSAGAMVLPFLSLLAVLLFFSTLALLLSLLLPSRRLAAMFAGGVLLASFFLMTLARIDKGLENVAQFSPLAYYQGGDAISGLNGKWFAGLLAVAGLFTVLAWWLFECRDVRVVGEGSWRWPQLRRKRAA